MNIAQDELVGLMQSIREQGLLQAPVVVKNNSGGYDLVAGRRRFLACSKLGWTKLKCALEVDQTPKDVLFKNLVENIQRSNISLTEIGRFIEKLKKQDMTSAEIAVRLGVSKGYVETASRAYNEVPKEYQKDLVLMKGNERPKPGKIPITTAKAIINAKKSYRLTNTEASKLFKAAKGDDKFQPQQILKYAQAIKAGKKKFTEVVRPLRTIHLQCYVTEDHYNDLKTKYIDNGPFKSVTELLFAVLKGEKNVKIDAKARRT